MSHARSFLLRIVLCFLFAAIASHAQDSATGALRGTVFDPAGSRIPQATIVVINAATGSRHERRNYWNPSRRLGIRRFRRSALPSSAFASRTMASRIERC